MEMKILDAAQAYGEALKKGGGVGPAVGDGDKFKDMLTDAIKDTVDATAGAETASIKAVTGDADLIDVVAAVNNAELVVETVVAVRDRVIQAYNEIIRMPI